MSPGSSIESTKIKNEVDTDPVEVAENVGEDFIPYRSFSWVPGV